nr:MAG TPA: hypothetical protein [Bacteriophage sp.]
MVGDKFLKLNKLFFCYDVSKFPSSVTLELSGANPIIS